MLVGLNDGQVALEQSDGSTIALPLERLCKSDQAIVKIAVAGR